MTNARGSGMTSDQMKNAPQGAVFVYAGDHRYSRNLAHHLGRSDLVLCPLDYRLVVKRICGTQRQVVIDHALPLDQNRRAWQEFKEILDLADMQKRWAT
jgi:hypothetical protein